MASTDCNNENDALEDDPLTEDLLPTSNITFDKDKHVMYFKRCMAYLPEPYTNNDTNRMTLAFFGLGGLDLLNMIETIYSAEQREQWIDWIYAQQILPDKDNPGKLLNTLLRSNVPRLKFQSLRPWLELNRHICGFRGSPFSGLPYSREGCRESRFPFDAAHLAMTYTALCSLLILGDDFSRIDRGAIINGLTYLQKDDGSFTQTYHGMESDMRFLYCACAISYMLKDFSGINIEKCVDYIRRSQGYDYGIGQKPGLESHGGSTYCAISALSLLNKIDEGLISKDRTIFWLLSRQVSGFQGRANKPEDTCYSFWIGASLKPSFDLKILGAFDYIDKEANRLFLSTTQGRQGGFSKWPDLIPDIMHAYMGIAGLSLMDEPGMSTLDCALNISRKARQNLENSVFWQGD
ncbi:10309_t:CDS:2 [Paraglomus occultum]|uniref:Geranylgeranyl transferase type-1 subunit beta n=1 Tax=Paraglomus occultum TaxID=144539 RepID=A0A9N8VLZ0_9GLOM|nr:10309_t:CDS:2 [Paraglomus occultum]